LLRCEVVPRRPGDDGAARDAGRSRARLPHGRAAALLRRGRGPPVPARVESPDEAARVARTHWGLRRHSALILAQPPPESLDVEPLVEQALAAAEEEGISGPALTPYVLAFLHERSNGETLRVNRELVLENAQLAAHVAVAFGKISDA
jgi:pseudouridine-5'-phosphate glycosidase